MNLDHGRYSLNILILSRPFFFPQSLSPLPFPQQNQSLRKEERKRLHSLAERRYPLRGQFNNISRDIFYAKQPQFYLLGLGISGLTFKPFAKIRLSSSYVSLYVDLSDSLRMVSKAKRRKAIRYGKPLPLELQREIGQACKLAVGHYLEH